MAFTFTLFFNTSFVMLLCVFVVFHFYSSENDDDDFVRSHSVFYGSSGEQNCKRLHSLSDYKAKCFYVKSNDPCVSDGYVNYLFYCKVGEFPLLGHTFLFQRLLVLLYLWANTTSKYFCPSLDDSVHESVKILNDWENHKASVRSLVPLASAQPTKKRKETAEIV
ncbi:unnamed protein product [Lupinus luteus]|uniref:Uncharacterized protein n=1 Tax=Lupinus luteus TaxID=3873 RepID=A0AAV1Y0U3_LUPLU